MGRAGGGFSGGRQSGGRSFSGSGSRSSRSSGRSGGSFSRSGLGGSGGSFSRSGLGGSGGSSSRGGLGSSKSSGSSFGSGSFGNGFGRPRTVIVPPVFSRGRTIIINNGGNSTGNGSSMGSGNSTGNRNSGQNSANQTTGSYRMEQPMIPQPLTPEQKINRAERLAKEAGDGKKGTMKVMLVAVIIVAIGIFFLVSAKSKAYEKAELSGTNNVGYVKDGGFLSGGRETEAAVKEFYQKTGIPLYLYTIAQYENDQSTCNSYAEWLYDELFSDENHALLVYYDDLEYWSYCLGEKAVPFLSDAEISALINSIRVYWYHDDYINYTNDEVMAMGIKDYTKELTSAGSNFKIFAVVILLVGGVIFIWAVFSYISKSGAEKRYTEEASTLRTEQMLNKPLETFGNVEIENLKDKYD